MIAERIHRGESPEQIGITPAEYASRLETLQRYLAERGDFSVEGYLDWIATQAEGQPGGAGTVSSDSSQSATHTHCGTCAQEKSLPSKWQMAKNLVKATSQHVSTGMKNVSDEEFEARKAACDACEYLLQPAERCSVCGCYTKVKARWQSSQCPKGKWR